MDQLPDSHPNVNKIKKLKLTIIHLFNTHSIHKN